MTGTGQGDGVKRRDRREREVAANNFTFNKDEEKCIVEILGLEKREIFSNIRNRAKDESEFQDLKRALFFANLEGMVSRELAAGVLKQDDGTARDRRQQIDGVLEAAKHLISTLRPMLGSGATALHREIRGELAHAVIEHPAQDGRRRRHTGGQEQRLDDLISGGFSAPDHRMVLEILEDFSGRLTELREDQTNAGRRRSPGFVGELCDAYAAVTGDGATTYVDGAAVRFVGAVIDAMNRFFAESNLVGATLSANAENVKAMIRSHFREKTRAENTQRIP